MTRPSGVRPDDPVTRALLAARDGDERAFVEVVRATQAEVWRFCGHLSTPAQAEDVAQEVYLRAHRALPRYRGDASARTWLLAIARTTCADAVRASQRRRRLQARLEAEAASAEVDAPDPTAATGVRQLVERLDPDRRDAFVLTQVLGLGYAEAAEVCGVPVGTIRSRVSRARDDLVTALAEADAAGAEEGQDRRRRRRNG